MKTPQEPPTKKSLDDVRAEFENDCLDEGYSIERLPDGRYASITVQREFEAIAVPYGYEPPKTSSTWLKIAVAAIVAAAICWSLFRCGGSGDNPPSSNTECHNNTVTGTRVCSDTAK